MKSKIAAVKDLSNRVGFKVQVTVERRMQPLCVYSLLISEHCLLHKREATSTRHSQAVTSRVKASMGPIVSHPNHLPAASG